MIVATGITKIFTGEPILENVDFKIGGSRKIGIVGRNGCGKTTLLKLILDEYLPDEGKIQKQDENIGAIPQELNFPKNMLVGELLESKLKNSWDGYLIDILVEELDFSNYDPYQELTTLSEGQKLKIKMMEVLLDDPSTLLIDEPTNHLDIEGIFWFERYVKRLDRNVVMISHDREFLNNTVDEIWEIEDKKLRIFVGGYDNYKEEKLKLIDKWNEEYVLFLKKKKALNELLTNVRKIKDGKKRGRAVSSAKKRIDREIESNSKEKYEEKKIKKVSFATDVSSKKLMIRFSDVCKSYGDRQVFENLSFEIRGGDKVWLLGPNGAGKSTCVKMIMGDEKPTSGDVYIGDNMKIGYFAQKQTHLDMEEKVLDVFMAQTGCYYGKAFGFLKKFLFDKDDVEKRVRHLSPGQRARFAFAIFAYNDYDMLILDEPTNHLDVETKEVIEESLAEFKGTLLLVSHDRFFVERVGLNRMLNLKHGKITEL